MSLLVFAIVLSVLIIVHEWGHFITARLLGVRVEKFAVGFGPKLFSRRTKETEYLLCAIPMGGYVKLAGDERSQCQGRPEEFYSHPVGHRALIVFMGPIVNLIFAYICFVFVYIAGFPALAPTVGKVMAGFPAMIADLREGDKIIRIDGKTITNWEDMQQAVASSGGRTLQVSLVRCQEELRKDLTPKEQSHKNIFGEDQKVWLLGIQPKGDMVFLRYKFGESFVKAGQQIVSIVSTTFKALLRVVSGGMEAKDALAGPIRIFDVIKNAASMGLSAVVYIMGVISTSLAIFNLFPIPVLDGGHIFFLAVEKISGRPLPVKVEENLIKGGFALLLLLMMFVFYNDIVEVGWIEQLRKLLQHVRP